MSRTKKEHKCECGAELETYQDSCEECCEHAFDPDEGYHCLNCSKDGSEEVLSSAYDRAKDLRKYGDS